MLMGWGLAVVQRAGPALWCAPTCARLSDSAACSGAGDFQRLGPVASVVARFYTPGPQSVLTHDLPAGPCCPRSAQGQRAGAGLCGLQHLHCSGGRHAACASCFAAVWVGQYEWGGLRASQRGWGGQPRAQRLPGLCFNHHYPLELRHYLPTHTFIPSPPPTHVHTPRHPPTDPALTPTHPHPALIRPPSRCWRSGTRWAPRGASSRRGRSCATPPTSSASRAGASNLSALRARGWRERLAARGAPALALPVRSVFFGCVAGLPAGAAAVRMSMHDLGLGISVHQLLALGTFQFPVARSALVVCLGSYTAFLLLLQRLWNL